jgi:hypothetical protein
MAGSVKRGGRIFEVTKAERKVADLLPIEVDPGVARATIRTVPFWFHTFALNRAEGIYTPGQARDHRYRVPFLPADFTALRVLDVGTFDGFYAFLAEHRGARRVLAVDNEQYRLWVAARWGIELEGAAGFRAIHRLLSSTVEYRRMDAGRSRSVCSLGLERRSPRVDFGSGSRYGRAVLGLCPALDRCEGLKEVVGWGSFTSTKRRRRS